MLKLIHDLKLLFLVFFLQNAIVFGQCNNNNLINQGTIVPTTTPQNTGAVDQNRPYWQFNANAGCEYTFTTCGNASWDTYLWLYADGAIGSWVQVSSNDDNCGGAYQSTIVWTAPSSGVYNILLTRYGSGTCNNLNGNSTFLTYSTNCSPAPTCTGSANANDVCSGATPLTVNANCSTTAWSIDPTYEDCVNPSTNCTQNGQVEDMWFSFTATTTSTEIEVANTDRRMLFAVYSGTCGSLTQIDCVDDIATQGTESATIATAIGQTYYIQVVRTNSDGATNTMNGTICVYNAPTPTCNDGIQNQGESGIDCGGPCPACPVLCSDLGFENMSSSADGVLVTGWDLLIGRNNVAGPYTIEQPLSTSTYDCSANFTSHNTSTLCAGTGGIKVFHNDFQHHDIKPNSGLGDLINIPNLPNFSGSNNRCIRLGGEQQIGSQASGMRTTININDPYLVYHYILRFENTGHTINNRGFCTFRIKDAGNTILPCGSFEVYENGPTETWSYDNGWDTWYMPNWRSVIVDVSDYIGQTITIEVWVADCQEGAHAGWGYFDFECLSSATPDCSVLPVELVNFKGECDKGRPILTWTTVSERNNDYFTIWHSNDGITFNEIGKVNGSGNSSQQIDYRFELSNLYNNVNYFYITQTDYDGSIERFNTISFEDCFKNNNEPIIYKDHEGIIHVYGVKIESIGFYDLNGKLIKKVDEINSHSIIRTDNLSKGLYFINIRNKEGQVSSHKIMI